MFSSGPDQPEKPEWMEPPKIVKAVEKLGARDHVVFGGRLPANPHGPIEKAMVTGVPVEFATAAFVAPALGRSASQNRRQLRRQEVQQRPVGRSSPLVDSGPAPSQR